MESTYTKTTFNSYCDLLIQKDERIKKILKMYGYPMVMERKKGFEGLIKIILEQQVSLASALAVYKKLKKIINPITPQKLICLTDSQLKSCGFSRQKMKYARNLAQEIISNNLDMEELQKQSNQTIRERLISIKGIGQWTCDIYLLLCLNRLDLFPTGDLALVKSLVENRFIDTTKSKEKIISISDQFRPYRSIFAIILWHAYISKYNIKIN